MALCEAFSSSVQVFDRFILAPERYLLDIADLTMPDMTGHQLAGEIRKICSEVPVFYAPAIMVCRKQMETHSLKLD